MDLFLDQEESLPDTSPTVPEQSLREREDEENYLAGLQRLAEAQSTETPFKQRVLMVEIAARSTEVPRRTIRVPLNGSGAAMVNLRVQLEEEEDQDEVATQLMTNAGPRCEPGQQEGAGMMEADLGLDQVRQIALMDGLTDEEIVREYVSGVLGMVQTQRAMLMSTQEDSLVSVQVVDFDLPGADPKDEGSKQGSNETSAS